MDSYEKKYKEALERLKGLIEGTREDRCAIVEEDIIDIFPELKESEDDRIRKEIIYFLSRNTFQFGEDIDKYKSWITWLEKQGEKSPFNKERLMEVAKPETFEEQIEYWQRMCSIAEKIGKESLEKQGKQKPTLSERYENIAQSEWFKRTHDGMSISDEESKWSEEDDDDAWLNDIISKIENGCQLNRAEIDWLKSIKEKLHKQIHYWTEEEIEPIISDYLRGTEHYGGMIGRLRCLKPKYLEKQGEQKPADKVESKFHEGDWIVNNDSGGVFKITEIKDDEYCLWPLDAEIMGYLRIIDVDNDYHLWTIQDAKDGDVLFSDLMGGKTFIYNGVNSDKAILYSFIISNDGEDVLQYYIGKPNTGIGNIEENKNIIHPATKEQRELLFQKMKDAGYEWDEEKKELDKIKNSPVLSNSLNIGKKSWTEEDEKCIDNCCLLIGAADDCYEKTFKDDCIHYLQSLKERMEEL